MAPGPQAAYADEDIKLFFNKNRVAFDQKPVIQEGRTLVPFRAVGESMGYDIEWDGDKQTVTAKNGGNTVVFVINSPVAIVNGETKGLDVPAKILGDRTMIPLRFLNENLGYDVEWFGGPRLILVGDLDDFYADRDDWDDMDDLLEAYLGIDDVDDFYDDDWDDIYEDDDRDDDDDDDDDWDDQWDD